MARMTVEMGQLEVQLKVLGERENLRRILQAGVEKCVEILQNRTDEKHHIITGDMRAGIKGGKIHEDVGSIWQDVYPQGNDRRGKSNAVKAYVINYGRGGRKTPKTGDKFITGKSAELKSAVRGAMAAEAEKIKNEVMR